MREKKVKVKITKSSDLVGISTYRVEVLYPFEGWAFIADCATRKIALVIKKYLLSNGTS